jgi:hypothetical protein
MALNVSILVLPDGGWGDQATDYGRLGEKKRVVAYALEKGFTVIVLDGRDCCRDLFEQRMNDRPKHAFVCGTGHGNQQYYTGYEEEILLEPSNYGLMAGRIGSFRSCTFGQSAPTRIQAGQIADTGYDDTLYFNVSGSDPDTDQVLKMYWDAFYEYDQRLLDGLTHKEASDSQDKKYDEVIAKADYYNAQYLRWDENCLRHRGDDNAKLAPPTPPNTVKLWYILDSEPPSLAGDMTENPDGSYSYSFKFPREGTYNFIYHAYRADGEEKETATGDFTVVFPTSSIVITPISPTAGDKIEARSVVAKVSIDWGK